MKINIHMFKREAIEEYTEIIKTIVHLNQKHAGSTGFLQTLEEDAKVELINFLLPPEGAKGK